jgi:acetylornithine deacetylase/succinyl-diaminopimelate desuccinylase-like protein
VATLANALDRLEGEMSRAMADLGTLVRIPSVSAKGFDPDEVARCARAVEELLREAGLHEVELLELPGAHPCVVGEWVGAGATAPTVLIYAHYDVQPPGRPSAWRSPAFEPTAGDDGRLYGRGVADDKGGLLVHVAAVRAWLESCGRLPVNVRFLVEGEEEIGSPHLTDFLRTHRSRFDADAIVLSDTSNLDTGLPSITTSLRGLVVVDVAVRALDHPLHSGIWGGPVMDAATALVRLLARLVDDRGVIQVQGILDDVPELDGGFVARLRALPLDEEGLRAQAGIDASIGWAGKVEMPIAQRLWWHPSLSITALEGTSFANAANQLADVARARIGLRLAPGQDAQRAARRLVDFLRCDPPCGVAVETSIHTASPGWSIVAEGPAFEAARRALAAGYGCEPVEIGCGGSIPFVGPFAQVLGGVPALLLGVEDPYCNAHGENESLSVDDFRKAARAATILLEELRAVREEC